MRLFDLFSGLWDFMALLNLSEPEVDPIIDEMIEFVEYVRQHPKMFDSARIDFEPVRQSDSDILWLKLLPLSEKCQ